MLGDVTLIRSIAILCALGSAPAALAGPVHQPAGANLTYGNVTHGQRVLSATSNPAAAAANVAGGAKSATGTVLSIGAGIEYGNLDEIFETIDELSAAFAPSDSGDGDSGGTGPDGDDPVPVNPKEPIDIGNIVDTLFPDFEKVVDSIATEVATRAAILALIAAEGHAKAYASADAPFVIGNEVLGGAWTFGVNWSGTAKAVGLAQPIAFNAEQALAELTAIYDASLPADGLPRLYDLSGDVNVFIDQATGNYGINFANDSSFLTKAAQTLEVSLGYSWLAQKTAKGSLFLGVEGNFYDLALSRVSVRFGDITDSEDVFDAIRDSDFEYDQGIGIDLGVLWAGPGYQVGATLNNLNEPKFEYPEIDLSNYSNSDIISFLQRDRTYTMERQLRLEGSYFTENRNWTFNIGLDANEIKDPVGDEFQWLTVSAGYATESWWVPGLRFGYRENLAGTRLRYFGVGATVFRILNIDLASTLDRVTINDEDLPRGLAASIGFDISF